MDSTFGILPEPGILVKRNDQITAFLKELIDQNREKYGLLYNGNRHNHVAHVREKDNQEKWIKLQSLLIYSLGIISSVPAWMYYGTTQSSVLRG